MNPLKNKILVIEDEAEIRDLISMSLAREGFSVITASDANEALNIISHLTPDVICLDWMLPGLSGIELLQVLKGRKLNEKSAVLMVTAKTEPEAIVTGLEAGADDYLTKPFEPKILLARVKALLRRSGQFSTAQSQEARADTIVFGPLKIDVSSHELCLEGEMISLTPLEFKVLCTLISSAGKVLTRERLLQEIQDGGISVIKRTIDTHVFGIRKKLGRHGGIIETIRGVGYRIRIQEK